jgi:hypothetical protein
VILSAVVAAMLVAGQPHSAAFWHQIAQNKYTVPADGNLTASLLRITKVVRARIPMEGAWPRHIH